jgi:Ca2+-binding RTX toxin-like protein
MTRISADAGFRLRMDANGNIPELNGLWNVFTARSSPGVFSAQLVQGGPYSTRYTINLEGDVVSDASGKVSGAIGALSLTATSSSSLGQRGLQLEVKGMDATVARVSRLPLSLFLSGDDAITGSSFSDVIHGGHGNDDLHGRTGADLVFGDAGNDTLIGGVRDADKLYGGMGDDTFFVSDARHRVIEYAEEGNDVVVADVSYTLTASLEIEALQAVSGNKAINLTGSETANMVYGNRGRNVLLGRGGDDTISGAAGNDTIEGGRGADQLFGQEGFDQLSYAGSSKGVIINLGDHYGYAGDALGDVIGEFEEVLGSRHSDHITGDDAGNRLIGGRGNDLLVGAGGNDILLGERGNDSLVGGAGYDRLDYSKDDARKGVMVDLTLGAATDGYGGRDAVSNFEEVRGSRFQDVVTGSALDETLHGEGGNDRLSGKDGNDRLVGGAGSDTLTGGLGSDVFVFNSRPNGRTNVDRVTDFNTKEDLFYIDCAVIKGVGWFSRPLKDDFFHLGKGAEDKLNRIIYDKNTGTLYYDPDGAGSKAQTKIAVLTNKTNIEPSHFWVI